MSWRSFYLRKKFYIKDFLGGGKLWNEYRDVRRVSLTGDRREMLSGMIKYVRENIPYYKDMDLSALDSFPVVNKGIINGSYNSFLAPEDVIPGQCGKLHVQKTSGSTGTPFMIPLDTRCRLRRLATIKYENDLIGFHSFEPLMHLRAVSHYWEGFVDKYDKDLNIWYSDNTNLTDNRLQTIVDTINRNAIRYVRGYMTTLDFITSYAKEKGIGFPHHPFFISVGELMLESLRDRCVNDLGCNIVSQYANEENGIFGTSETNGVGTNINLNRANCIIEILKLDSDEPAGIGDTGRIVVTDLINHALPMIRYDIGDLAAIAEFGEDGYAKKLTKLSGRASDLIRRTDGSFVDFYNSMPKEVFLNKDISQWQFIQKTEREYLLKISMADGSGTLDEGPIIDGMKGILGKDALILIEYVDEIPVLNSGKRRVIINEWKQT